LKLKLVKFNKLSILVSVIPLWNAVNTYIKVIWRKYFLLVQKASLICFLSLYRLVSRIQSIYLATALYILFYPDLDVINHEMIKVSMPNVYIFLHLVIIWYNYIFYFYFSYFLLKLNMHLKNMLHFGTCLINKYLIRNFIPPNL